MKNDGGQENIKEDLWVKGHLKQKQKDPDIGISLIDEKIRKKDIYALIFQK